MERFIGRIPAFYETAKNNEPMFRGVLSRLPNDAAEVITVPEDIAGEAKIEDLLAKYSPEDEPASYGKFKIINFQLGPITEDPFLSLAEDELLIAVTDLAVLSGSGAVFKYRQIEPDGELEYLGVMLNWRS